MSVTRQFKVLEPATENGWVDGSLKVGFASTDMKTVNQHFGSALSLAIFAVDIENFKMLEVVQFERPVADTEESTDSSGTNLVGAQATPEGSPPGKEENTDSSGTNLVGAQATPEGSPPGKEENKLIEKIVALNGCVAIYAQAIGASAVGHLKAHGIHPVKVSAGTEIKNLLGHLQDELRLGPNAWLANAIKSHMTLDPARFDEMEADGWEE